MAAYDDNAPGEYLRFRSKVQLGDGPDQRGDITVESRTDTGPLGEKSTNEAFADFANEVDRATDLLRNQLGLEEAEDGD